ncbi:serine/arginine repetitive matrix protein 2-like [Thunnus maccoyii]|uniref:serine/arginine repetitive matrix protein 2-like n=1 Tax=Thunnus maccoyii TaxID=8240 RepID=UPI001C4C0EF4|nr:serine/arginine repetitive matrix protein 2-like [Thunnus maccoyii]
MFTRKRNATKEAWEFIIKELDLEGVVSPKQVSKKWENIKKMYKELRRPPTGSGTDQGEETPATWSFYLDMHEAMGSKSSVTPPVLIASCMSSPTILPGPSPFRMPDSSPSDPLTPSDPVSLPSTSSSSPEPPQPPPAKKKRVTTELLIDFYRKKRTRKKSDASRLHNKQKNEFI